MNFLQRRYDMELFLLQNGSFVCCCLGNDFFYDVFCLDVGDDYNRVHLFVLLG